MPFLNSAAPHGGAAPSPPPKLDTKLLSLLLKVAIMVLLTTLFFVFVGLATALFLLHLSFAGTAHRRRRRRTDSSSGFAPAELKKLLQFRFSDWANPHCRIDCPICLDGFRVGQWCRRIGRCGHFFHRRCIDSWLVRVSACPLCRCSVRLDLDVDDDDDGQVDCVSERNCRVFYAS